MENKIGEIVTLPDGRKAKVVEVKSASCKGCIILDFEYYCENGRRFGECSSMFRSDHKGVIYKEVKNDRL